MKIVFCDKNLLCALGLNLIGEALKIMTVHDRRMVSVE